ncbi:hypothetical protein NC651_017467 [Populus alba x Populus x berolinensis]|nr:hypothetical protein NC651_017467 [Populus alba x Populus x berolinensis]
MKSRVFLFRLSKGDFCGEGEKRERGGGGGGTVCGYYSLEVSSWSVWLAVGKRKCMRALSTERRRKRASLGGGSFFFFKGSSAAG